MGTDLLQRHDVADALPQSRVALGGAVLQYGRALPGDQLADHVADDLERERGHVRRAAGQRYDLGPGRDGEQRPDFRSHHANCPLGVLADVAVDSLRLRFGCHGVSSTSRWIISATCRRLAANAYSGNLTRLAGHGPRKTVTWNSRRSPGFLRCYSSGEAAARSLMSTACPPGTCCSRRRSTCPARLRFRPA